MCIGSDFGDDIAGLLLYRLIHKRLVNIKAIFCGTTPERFLAEVKASKPSLVLMVNSVDRSLKPGTLVVEDLLEHHCKPLIIHNLPLTLLAQVLASELKGCVFKLIGVQALKAYGPPSKPVVQAVRTLAKTILEFDKYAKGGTAD
jgi:Ni,Fe-hydrogenase maturation factor